MDLAPARDGPVTFTRYSTANPDESDSMSKGWAGVRDQESLDYFRHRERAERAAAKKALSDAARRVHQELAQEYAELIRKQALGVSRGAEARR